MLVKRGNYSLKAVMIWGDTIYERDLGPQHWMAGIWSLFPEFNANVSVWKKWSSRILERSTHHDSLAQKDVLDVEVESRNKPL